MVVAIIASFLLCPTFAADFAKVKDGVVVYVAAGGDDPPSNGGPWIKTPYDEETGIGKVGVGWSYDGKNFFPPPSTPQPAVSTFTVVASTPTK